MSSVDPLRYLGRVTPQTRAIAQEVTDAAAAVGYPVTVLWGMGGGEHATGRALDFMVSHAGSLITDPQAAGNFIADYLWTHRDRLGLIHEIWRQRIRSTDPRYSPGQWVWMEDRGSPTENHYDHVHALFNGVYTPPATPPIPTQILEETMIVISCPARGIAVIGPGYWYPVPNADHVHSAIKLCNGRVLETNDAAEFDRWRAIACSGVSSPVPTAPPAPTPVKTSDDVAREVWDGLWGAGDERRRRLTDAGYDYDTIQALVSKGRPA